MLAEPSARRPHWQAAAAISAKAGGRDHRKLGNMADRDPALIAVAFGLPADLVEVHPGRIEVEIEMEIEIDIELSGQLEEPARSAPADRCRYRGSRRADRRRPAGRRPAAPRRRDRWSALPAGRRRSKGRRPRHSPPSSALIASKLRRPSTRIDLDMGAHPGGALGDRLLEHAGAALVDIRRR